MPRPKSKEELLLLGEQNYQSLNVLIDSMSVKEQEQAFSFEDRDKNIRDVLIHLHEWHNMMAIWYQDGMNGIKPTFLAPGYPPRMSPQLNLKIWEQYQQTSLQEAKELLAASHTRIMGFVQSHSNEELFTKKYYKWTGTTSLGSYLVSSTSSHYDWALKKIKKHKKTL